MGLEVPTYISDFVSTNPVDGDPRAQGAAHIRNMKIAIKASFTGITGAVSATHTEINKLVGIGANKLVLKNTSDILVGSLGTSVQNLGSVNSLAVDAAVSNWFMAQCNAAVDITIANRVTGKELYILFKNTDGVNTHTISYFGGAATSWDFGSPLFLDINVSLLYIKFLTAGIDFRMMRSFSS